MMKIFITILLLLTAAFLTDGAKILGVFPVPGRSHYLLGSTLLKALAEKGHDVTMISCFGEKDPPKNGTYRDVVVSGLLKAMQDGQKDQKMNLFNREDSNPFATAVFFGFMMPQFMEVILKDESVQKLINSDEKFDVVIVEQFLNDAQKALSTHFGAPLITFNTVGPNFWINPLVGNPSPLSYVPDMMLDYTAPMTFFQRLLNTLLYVFNELFYNLYMFPQQNKMLKKHLPNGPDLYDVLYNTSIVLLNSHSSINQAVPHVPNMIEIGGFHVKPPRKLPSDLQEFLDNSKNGVIYFSMGSNLKSVDLPIEKRNAILNTFSKLKENVLWKWEDDSLPGQPPNVKLSKWLPQQDILAHPNVKLFITHGGYLSTTETIYHGVPILAIPIYGDQKLNALTAVNNGYGVVVPYSQLSEEKLTNTIHEILNNNN
ncbi:UDP-glycosyltransferase UGT5-like isoform X4 [Tenebrio molitor]|uniref:UDP-glycosyltransferase UGT5-like isoform X4 n=1 Tax=Tenebrio molitor TaxID=7067 RepID=UPI00362475E0